MAVELEVCDYCGKKQYVGSTIERYRCQLCGHANVCKHPSSVAEAKLAAQIKREEEEKKRKREFEEQAKQKEREQQRRSLEEQKIRLEEERRAIEEEERSRSALYSSQRLEYESRVRQEQEQREHEEVVYQGHVSAIKKLKQAAIDQRARKIKEFWCQSRSTWDEKEAQAADWYNAYFDDGDRRKLFFGKAVARSCRMGKAKFALKIKYAEIYTENWCGSLILRSDTGQDARADVSKIVEEDSLGFCRILDAKKEYIDTAPQRISIGELDQVDGIRSGVKPFIERFGRQIHRRTYVIDYTIGFVDYANELDLSCFTMQNFINLQVAYQSRIDKVKDSELVRRFCCCINNFYLNKKPLLPKEKDECIRLRPTCYSRSHTGSDNFYTQYPEDYCVLTDEERFVLACAIEEKTSFVVTEIKASFSGVECITLMNTAKNYPEKKRFL